MLHIWRDLALVLGHDVFQTPQTSSKSDQIGSSDELCSAWCVDRIEHFKSETLVFISVTFIILSQDVNTSVQTVNQIKAFCSFMYLFLAFCGIYK